MTPPQIPANCRPQAAPDMIAMRALLVRPRVVTVTGPHTVPDGTVTVKLVALAAVGVALIAPPPDVKDTELLAGTESKPKPVSMICWSGFNAIDGARSV